MSKTNLYIIGGIGAAILGALAYKKITGFNPFSGISSGIGNLLSGSGNDIEENEKNEKEIDSLESSGQIASFSDSEYKEGAKKIETALKGVGNDIDLVAEVFDGVKNEIDVRKLSSAFGIIDGQNLNTWLKTDLIQFTDSFISVEGSFGEISLFGYDFVSQMVREILSRKGISYAI